MSYATLTQLKSALKITDTSQDTYLTDLLAQVSAWIDTYTNRSWSANSVEVAGELHEGQGQRLWLRKTGITAITSVEVRDVRSDSWQTLAGDDYEWTANGRLIVPLNYAFVKVTYSYDSGGVPKDIEMAAIQLACKLHRTSNISRERIGDYQIEYQDVEAMVAASSDWPQAVLDSYRVRNV